MRHGFLQKQAKQMAACSRWKNRSRRSTLITEQSARGRDDGENGMSGAFNLDMSAISAFVSVGDKGGFRAAAAALGVTSAGVSKAVARLEAQLGVTLVARTTRSVRLTSAGLLF